MEVVLSHSRAIFGKIFGVSGVSWKEMRARQGE